MMLLQQELRYQRRKRKQAFEAVLPTEPESQTQQPPAKRQKQSHSSRGKTPPGFWDKLSRVPLCRRALREFNRRAIRLVAPQQHGKRDVEASQIKQLQRFARRGGPDLRGIRGYSEQQTQVEMSSKRSRSSRSRALESSTKPITFSSKDSAFEQALIDNGVYPPDYSSVKPGNLEEMIEKLGQPRASISPSKLSREEFVYFKKKDNEAKTEAQVMSQVFPMITGKANIPSGYNQVFNNLEPLVNHISSPQPDYFNGSRPAEIRRKVRDDLEKQIVPSSHRDRPALPIFFMEAKGPDGTSSELKRQITQDLGAGARGMLRMQSYGLDAPIFDDTAHTFGSTYHDGCIRLYAMHPTESGDANRKLEYHTTKIRGFDLTDSLDTHRQGIAAFRNLRDLAKERRDEFIALANERADNVDEPEANEPFTADSDNEESDTSIDELAMPAPQIKRTKR